MRVIHIGWMLALSAGVTGCHPPEMTAQASERTSLRFPANPGPYSSSAARNRVEGAQNDRPFDMYNYSPLSFPRQDQSLFVVPWDIRMQIATTSTADEQRFWLLATPRYDGNAWTESWIVKRADIVLDGMTKAMTWVSPPSSYPPPALMFTYVESDPTVRCRPYHLYRFQLFYATRKPVWDAALGHYVLLWGPEHREDLPVARVVRPGAGGGVRSLKVNVDGGGTRSLLLFSGTKGAMQGNGIPFDGNPKGLGPFSTPEIELVIWNQSTSRTTIQSITFANPPTDPSANSAQWAFANGGLQSPVTLNCGDSYRFGLTSSVSDVPVEIDLKTDAGNLRVWLVYVNAGG